MCKKIFDDTKVMTAIAAKKSVAAQNSYVVQKIR